MRPPYDIDRASAELAQADPRLGELIARVGPCRLTLRDMHSPFLGLLRAIVYQQLTGKAAATIYDRLCGLFEGGEPEPRALLALPLERLRAVGLSGAKAAAAYDLAEKTLAGVVPPREALTRMADEEIIERLVQVRGIGRWTVEMLLIFNLGRANVLPVGDLGVRRGVMRIYRLAAMPTPTEVRRYGEPWAPYRSVASWYLWRAAEQA